MAWRRPELKWPNDLLYDGKKVCGLLVEQRGERIAVGIGVNVRHQPKDFPPEIARRATSLEMAAGGRVERGDVLHAILSELDRRLLQLRAGGFEPIREEWAQGCGILGRRIAAPDAEGVVEDVDPEGALLVKTRDGLRRVMAGELRFPREAE
jgi:BirA family biotin operon repressor/biotin-[acetyl-CoA-carboxylase] ligase